jgi:hypothetical protein
MWSDFDDVFHVSLPLCALDDSLLFWDSGTMQDSTSDEFDVSQPFTF